MMLRARHSFTGIMVIFLGALASFSGVAVSAQNFTDIKPSPQQVEWQDLEFGVIIHFGPNTFLDQRMGRRNGQPSSL